METESEEHTLAYVFEVLWIPIAIMFYFNYLVFIVAQIIKNNSLEDIFLAILMLSLNLISLVIRGNWVLRNIICFSLLSLYTLRITVHLILRFGKEDRRYGDMRDQLMNVGCCCYTLGFFFLFTFYSIFTVFFNIPSLYMILYAEEGLPALAVAGAVVILLGIGIETLADWQLEKFRSNPENKGTMNKEGLWRYSRHPNYFGDTLMWWGVSMMAWSVEGGWKTVYVPLIQTIMMRYFTGVPLLEEQFQNRPGFQRYCRETSAFVPWFVNYEAGERYAREESEKEPLVEKEEHQA